MELRHLRYFVAVAEEPHFGRAVERLRDAQPAVSAQVRRLEEELGVRLLVCSSRSVRLSEAGRVFLEDARASLDHSDRAVRRAQRAASGEEGRVWVGLAFYRGRDGAEGLLACPLVSATIRSKSHSPGLTSYSALNLYAAERSSSEDSPPADAYPKAPATSGRSESGFRTCHLTPPS